MNIMKAKSPPPSSPPSIFSIWLDMKGSMKREEKQLQGRGEGGGMTSKGLLGLPNMLFTIRCNILHL